MRTAGLVTIALLAAALVYGESTAAELLTADVDGWHTWRTDEPGTVTGMCCFTRDPGAQSQTGCNLDGSRVSYGNGGNCSAEPGHAQIYALMKNGNLTRIRVLSSECPVSTETQLTDHGVISNDKNIEWFSSVIENEQISQDIREEALFGLVQSESDAAFEYIDRLLSRR
jgi:hypothetical protein